MTRAHSLASLGITTSESFIRKLKGAADPVQCGGAEVGQASSSHSSLSKIDLAALAWRERHQGLQIPRLAPLLAEWVFDTLSNAAKQASKAKGGNVAATSPLAQPAYYALLADLLCEPALKGASHSTISPRLTPQSVLLLATCLLKLDAASTRKCLPEASTSIGPLLAQVAAHLSSSSRSNIDDFFSLACSKVSELSAEDSEAAQGIAVLLEALQTPYHEAAVENSALSVKSLQSLGIDGFAKAATHLQSFSPSDDGFNSLKEALRQWAEGTLFNVHALRSQLLPSTSSSSSLNCVRTAADAGTQAATEILPHLVQSALRNTRLHSGELANSLRNHARKLANAEADDADETAAPEVATGSLYEAFQDAMLAPALVSTSSPDATPAAVAARSKLLEIIADSGLTPQLSRTMAWSTMLRKTLGAIRSSLDGESLAHTAVVSLQLLWKLDQDLVREELDAIMLSLLSKSVDSQVRWTVQSFFSDLIEGFAKGQELPELLRLLQRSVAQCEGNIFDGDAAMESTWFNRAFGRAVRVQLPPTQIVEVLSDLATTLEQASESSAGADAVSPGKKRARQAGEGTTSFSPQSNLLRVAHPILASLSIPGALIEESSPSLDRIVASLRQTIGGVLASSVSSSKKAKRAKSSVSSVSQASPASHVIASALWAWYGLCAGQKASSAEQGPSARDHFTALDALWPDLFPFLASNEDSDGVRLEMTRMLLFKAEKALETGVPDEWYLTTEAVQSFWTGTVQRLCEGAAQKQQAPLWEMLARRWILVLEHACGEASLSKLAELLVPTLRPSKASEEQSSLRASSLLIVQNAEFWEMKRWRKAVVDAVQADDDSRLPALAHLPVQYLPTGVREGLILRALQAVGKKQVLQEDSIAIKEWLCAVLSREGGLSEKAQQALAGRLETFAAIKAGNDEVAQQQQQQVNSRLFQLALKRLILARHTTTSSLQELISAVSSNDFFLARLVETLIDTSSTRLVKEIKMPAHYDLAGTRTAVETLDVTSAASLSVASVTELLDRCRLALTLASVQDKNVEERSELASLCVSTFCSSATVAGLVPPLAEATEQTSQSFLAAFAALLASCAKELTPANAGSNSLGARGVLSFASLLAARPNLLSLPALPKEIDTPWSLFLTRVTPEAYTGALDALIKALDHIDANADATSDEANLRALLFVLGTTLRTGPPKTLSAAQRFFTVALTRVQTAVLTARTKGGWSARETILSCLRVIESVANGRGVVFRHVDVGLVLSLLSGLLTGQGSLPPSSPPTTTKPTSPHPSHLAHSIFSTLLSILSSLVRLRRDLLVPLLPQLGIVLAQISPLVRRSLPQATVRQRRALREGMPGWLTVSGEEVVGVGGDKVVGAQENAAQLPEVIHLGASAAREFSRLLETIPAKSTSTGPFGSSSSGNAFTLAGSKKSSSGKGTSNVDSLSRPFAKHAAYVLLSYVHAIVQAGVYIDAAVKRELLGDPATGSAGRRGGRGGPNAEPPSSSSSSGGRGGGLTNLCGILGGGTAERDWILANDDLLSATVGAGGAGGSAEAGKAVFKDIWARYEAARYRGD